MTNIEWVKNPDGMTQGITLNPITGCKNHTPEGLCLDGLFPCYAYKLANGRLKQRYLNNQILPVGQFDDAFYTNNPLTDPFYPRFWEEKLLPRHRISSAGYRGRKDKGIFVCDMSDLFGIGIPNEWTDKVLRSIRSNPCDRFYLLTKQPQNLIKFSPFPENCWVGVTATGYKAFNNALDKLKCIEAKVKYISIEPLLEPIPFNMERLAYCGINWLIIGACTGTYLEMMKLHLKTDIPIPNVMKWGKKWTLQPRIEWVREIVEAADKAGVKVFLKDNLGPLGLPLDSLYYSQYETENGPEYRLRQEMPE
jgi:protein gp37